MSPLSNVDPLGLSLSQNHAKVFTELLKRLHSSDHPIDDSAIEGALKNGSKLSFEPNHVGAVLGIARAYRRRTDFCSGLRKFKLLSHSRRPEEELSPASVHIEQESQWEIEKYQNHVKKESQSISEWICHWALNSRPANSRPSEGSITGQTSDTVVLSDLKHIPNLSRLTVQDCLELMDDVIALTEDYSNPLYLQMIGNKNIIL